MTDLRQDPSLRELGPPLLRRPDALPLPDPDTAPRPADACTGTHGTWVRIPNAHPVAAEYKGYRLGDGPHLYVYFYFEVTVRFEATLRCTNGCAPGESRDMAFSQDVLVPIEYREDVTHQMVRSVLPGPIRLLLLLRTLIRLGAHALDFFRQNEELMRALEACLSPMLTLVGNSADLICAGRFDHRQLEEMLRSMMRRELLAGPDTA